MRHLPSLKGVQIKGVCRGFSKIFSDSFLEKLSVFTGYDRRGGKIRGKDFVGSCLRMVEQDGWGGSLNAQCMILNEECGVLVKEQSLDERFNKRSEALMQTLFELVMNRHLGVVNPMKLLEGFEEVYVQDSTNIELPAILKHIYRGSGGGASEAGLKIDAVYGLRWGQMELMFHDSAGSDTWQGVPPMKKGSLLLRDLGYFKLDDLELIDKREAYFVSRLKFNANVYEDEETEQTLDLQAILNGMAENEIRQMWVYVGQHKRLRVRMVLQKVPKSVADHKRHKLKIDKQNKRKTISKERLDFCDANCYITNITAEMMEESQIITLYGLRWIIEILFKAWKSIAGLKDKINSMKGHRFMCLLYAHMIRLLLDSKVVHFFKIEFWNLFGFKISELKAFSVLRTFAPQWRKALQSGMEDIIDSVFENIGRTILALAEKRKYGKKESYNDFYIFVKSQT